MNQTVQMCKNVHDHVGEVQEPQTARSETWCKINAGQCITEMLSILENLVFF